MLSVAKDGCGLKSLWVWWFAMTWGWFRGPPLQKPPSRGLEGSGGQGGGSVQGGGERSRGGGGDEGQG